MKLLSYTNIIMFKTETHTAAKLVWLIHQQVNLSGCDFGKVISLKGLTRKESDRSQERAK